MKKNRKYLFMSVWGYSILITVTAEFSTRAKMGRCITVLKFVLTSGDISVEQMSCI